MTSLSKGKSFASLFKKYRLRSEIETLTEFGDLLAEEGLVYETSLFTRWQKGDRVPKDRKTLLSIVSVFIRRGGITNYSEANNILATANQGYLTTDERNAIHSNFSNSLLSLPAENVGNLIKEFRIRRNMSQQDMSLLLGWSDSTKVHDIETRNKQKHSRQLIDKISKVLELSDQEKSKLLLAGNYLPTLEEVENVRKQVNPILESWPYPAVFLDFSWRVLGENKKNNILYDQTEQFTEKIINNLPNLIEILYDDEFAMNKSKGQMLLKWREWQYEIMIHFKEIHKSRIKEDWYIDLITRMLDNKLFKEHWEKVQMENKLPVFSNHGLKIIPNPYKTNQLLKFHFFVVPLFGDPRFEIEFFTPADQNTFNFYSTSQTKHYLT